LTVVKTPSPVLRIIKNMSKDPLQESRVLFITVTNVGKYPVDLDVLYRVFSRYGTVEKVFFSFVNIFFFHVLFFSLQDNCIPKTNRALSVSYSTFEYFRSA
jgi:hypothetical protein